MFVRNALAARCALAAALLVALSLITGCGPGKYGRPVRVTGKATLDGEPLTLAGVRLHCLAGGLPPDLRTLTGKVDDKGSFSFPKVYPAEYQVSFFTLHEPTVTKKDASGEELILASPDMGPLANYAAHTTQLTANVSSETTHFEFELHGPRPRSPR